MLAWCKVERLGGEGIELRQIVLVRIALSRFVKDALSDRFEKCSRDRYFTFRAVVRLASAFAHTA
jgi:hypothetical protein